MFNKLGAKLEAYIKKAAYTGVIGLLIKEGILWPRVCGVCLHLSWPKPHICQLKILTVDGESVENPLYGKKRNLSGMACKDGFKPPTIESPSPGWEEEIESSAGDETGAMIILDEMKDALTERIDGETNKNVRRKYERQYVVFCRYVELVYQDGCSEKDALRRIAEKLVVSLGTVERDIREIREFLKKVISFDV